MIILPLYGQNTEAFKNNSVAGPTLNVMQKRQVFDKQANIIVAEMFKKNLLYRYISYSYFFATHKSSVQNKLISQLHIEFRKQGKHFPIS